MDRFNELKKEGTEPAMISSMKNMGSVIISAAIILAGTFAAIVAVRRSFLITDCNRGINRPSHVRNCRPSVFCTGHGENIRKRQLVAFQFEKITFNASACFRAEVFLFPYKSSS